MKKNFSRMAMVAAVFAAMASPALAGGGSECAIGAGHDGSAMTDAKGAECALHGKKDCCSHGHSNPKTNFGPKNRK